MDIKIHRLRWSISIGSQMAKGLRKVREQLGRLDGKRFCQLDDVLQGDIPFTALYPADVVAMQASPLGQFFLGIAPLVAELPQP